MLKGKKSCKNWLLEFLVEHRQKNNRAEMSGKNTVQKLRKAFGIKEAVKKGANRSRRHSDQGMRSR